MNGGQYAALVIALLLTPGALVEPTPFGELLVLSLYAYAFSGRFGG